MKKIKDVFITSLALIMALATPLQNALAAEGDPPPKIFITQVQTTGGVGKTSEDFVELFNPNDTAVNLNGMRLVKRTETGTVDAAIKSWSTDTLMQPHSFYLWANSTFTAIALTPETTTTSTLADNNGVALRLGANDTGTIIDALSWGTSNNTFPVGSSANPGAGLAIKRTDPFVATGAYTIETGSARNSTVTLEPTDPSPYATPYATPADPEPYATPYATPSDPEPYATPYATPADPAPYATPYASPYATPAPSTKTKSDLVTVTEILPNPSGTDPGHEQFELFNGDTETVDLSGWIVTDEATAPTGAAAYVLPSGTLINKGQYLAFAIPTGKISLNNSSADSIILYFADKAEAKRVQYPSPTPENKSWQFVGNQWVWNTPSLGAANTTPAPAPNPDEDEDEEEEEPAPTQLSKLRISEFMSNPPGTDTGREWIELQNFGTTSIKIENFAIDTKKTGSVSTKSFTLPDETVAAGERLALRIPEDTISLANNFGNIRLFDAQQHLLIEAPYKLIPEGKTVSFSNGHWFISEPSPNLESPALVASPLSFSEFLPSPDDDQSEFVEFGNASAQAIDLNGFALLINKRVVDIESISVPANGLAALESSDEAELHLPNSGTLVLLSPFSQVISTLVYKGGKSGFAYARFDVGFAWTDTSTPGEANVLTVPPAKSPKKSTPKKTSVAGAAANWVNETQDAAEWKNTDERAGFGESSTITDTAQSQPGHSRALPKFNLRSILFFGAASVSGAFAVWQMRAKH